MNYTYDPSDIVQPSISRVRFTLGDTNVAGGSNTCMLCDEEIEAILKTGYGWKTALYLLVDSVCMRLSYETDWRNDGSEFDLSQRAARWIEMRDKLKKESSFSLPLTSDGIPDSVAKLMSNGRLDAAWNELYFSASAGDEL